MSVTLHGFKYSVYTRIAKMALIKKGGDFDEVEINPFADDMPPEYLDLHPFRRVPTLVHDDLVLYETNAITRYIDEAFEGPNLQPTDPMARARMNQTLSIIDNYAYIPMVRQVFSHVVLRPLFDMEPDPEHIQLGLEGSIEALKALEKIAAEGHQLDGNSPTLADIHLAPMMAYFVMADEGREMLEGFSSLSNWWERIQVRESFLNTLPRGVFDK